MYNFGELKTKVAELVQRSGDSDYKDKIGVWLNMGQKFLFEIYDYWFDLQDIHNFTTVDGQGDYVLPNRFDKPLRIYDLTNNNKLEIKTEEEYFDGNITSIADATEGAPTYARIYGSSGLVTQVSATAGSIIKVKSSSTSDTAGMYVRVSGYIDTSFLIEDSENIQITPATPTTYASGSKTFYKITKLSKSANTIGYVTIANASDTVLDYLAPNERISKHKVLKLGLIPDDAYSMRLLFKRNISEMVSDYDYPFTECDRVLILDACGWATKQEKETELKSEFYWKKAEEALKVLLNNQNNKLGPDYTQKIVSVWAQAHKA